MNLIPENSTQTQITGATVPFYKFEINNQKYLQFDTSLCEHPEPMINAMCGLQNIKENEKLIMINHKAPMGLFAKVEADFTNEVEELANGKFKITFTKKLANSENTNFNDTACKG